MLEVIVPARRDPSRLIHSLSLGSRTPDLVTIVSNEVTDLPTFGLDVRVLSFDSSMYCYGAFDVVLRRNVGLWKAKGDHVVFQDDDQIASYDMLQASEDLLREGPMFWGHHRFAALDAPVPEIVRWPMDKGKSRELGTNRFHSHQSGYAGMFGARTAYLRDHLGGFDMAFLGRHAGEDQQLAKRYMEDTGASGLYIHEPPFAWHPEGRGEWISGPTNSCDGHDLLDKTVRGRISIHKCSRCPYREVSGELQTTYVIEPFRPSWVVIESTGLTGP